MRLLLALLLLIFLIPSSVHAQDIKNQNVFRGFIWGLPKDVIQDNEIGEYAGEEDNILFFKDKIRNLPVVIGYEFMDNKLWRARIFVEKRYTDQQDRMDDLLTIQTDLTNRLGPPTTEEMIWQSKREINYPKAWGWAVFRGELFIENKWEIGNTEVTTYLGAITKYNPILSVTYEHKPTKLKQQKGQEANPLIAP